MSYPHHWTRLLSLLPLLGLSLAPWAKADPVPWTTSRVQGTPEPPPLVRLERVHPGAQFREPSDFTYVAADQRWYVAELAGKLWSFPATGAEQAPELVVDFAALHQPFSQLLGFTVDPGFATNRFLYAAYVTVGDGPNRETGSRVVRIRVPSGQPPVAEPATESVILTWRGGGHNGCCLKFGPDGYLYVSTGDGEGPEPPDALRTGQNLSDLLSCILRVDVRHEDSGRLYRIPQDNPFANRPGARGEIWAYGFRNPWRMNFAPDRSLWVGDVGFELWEMIHRVTPGYNAGWSRTEGPQEIHRDQQPPTPIHPPLQVHPHSEAASITGGLFYRGQALPGLAGCYVYGDFETGKLWGLRPQGERVEWHRELADTTQKLVSFAEGPDQEIHVLDHRAGAGIYRIAPVPPASSTGEFPRQLSATGVFTDVGTQQPAPGVGAYSVQAPRWHDGAAARRWIGVPGSSAEEVRERFAFLRGTLLLKTLSVPGSGGPARPVETQMLHYDGQDWRAYSYRWNAAATDAELVPAAGLRAETDPEGTAGRRPAWNFGARAECLRCHNSWSGYVLGFNAAQLQVATAPRTATGEAETNAPPATPRRLADPSDATADLNLRARSWLHANCAPCHRWGAGGSVPAFFPFEEPLPQLRLTNAVPSRGTFGLEDARLIAPGHPERSVVWYRLNTLGPGHMPLAGSHTVDAAGSRLIADWIRSLAPTEPVPPVGEPSTPTAALNLLAQVLPAAPEPATVARAIQSPDPAVRDLFLRFAPDAVRPEVLGPGFDLATILAVPGDAQRGAAILRRSNGPNCLSCHRLGSEGREFGPELGAVARRLTDRQLLEQIVAPAQTVAPEYRLHLLELTDGSQLAGLVVRAVDGSLRVRTAAGPDRVLSPAEIRSDEPVAGSAMPEGLLANLSRQEAADLVAALRRGAQAATK